MNSKLKEYCEFLRTKIDKDVTKIQIVGEVIPCQSGYSYGRVEPEVLAFSIVLYRNSAVESFFPIEIIHSWHLKTVPVIHIARYGEIKDKLRGLAEGMEQVSGKETHIREGVVVRPRIDRKSSRGTWLRLKIINPKYKETGEELS
jgi:RNA ligase (TIGR02306 family)